MSKNRKLLRKETKPDAQVDKLNPETFCYRPRHERQRTVGRIWDSSKVIVIVGPAGTGKTSAAIGNSVTDLINKKIEHIFLARPAVSIGEDLGYDKGSLDEKIAPWIAPFHDAIEGFASVKLETLAAKLKYFTVGRVGGRTIRNAAMIVDEAQNLTRAQLTALVTRVGPNGKLILSGDYDQSQIERGTRNPLYRLCKAIGGKVDGFRVVEFLEDDQLREPFVREVSRVLKEADY